MYTVCPPLARVSSTYLLFDGHVWCIGTMPNEDFRKFLESHATTTERVSLLLEDMECYDQYARYYLLTIIMEWNRTSAKKCPVLLYPTQEEAEAALAAQQKAAA